MKSKKNAVPTQRLGLAGRRGWYCLALAGAGLPTVVHAESDAAASGLEEVVVTARYRDEKSQDVPIAMSVLSGTDIQARGISSAIDAAKSMPNVVMTPMGQQSGKAIGMVIRGVGQTDFAFSLQPGVGYYVDDVYQGTLYGQQFGLLDIADMQVLRGPQGTLAGRNSEGGAVKIYSVKPEGDGDGYAELGYGNYAHRRFRGAYDFSVIPDRLFVRVSGGWDEHDGYVTRLDYGCANPDSGVPTQTASAGDCVTGHEGGDDALSFRIRMRALVTDALEINFIGDVLDERSEPSASRKIQISTTGTVAGLLAEQYPQLNYGSSWVTDSFYTNYDSFSSVIGDHRASNYTNQPMDDFTMYSLAGIADWEIAGDLHLKSITAYRDYESTYSSSNTSPYGSLNYQDVLSHQFSQELQLTGQALDQALNWTLGGFYFTGRSITRGENLLTGLNFDFALDEPATDRNNSGFAHINYQLTDSLGLEAGVRHSEDDVSYTFNRWLVTPYAGSPVGTPTVTPNRYSTGSSRWDYKIGLTQHFTPDLMAYAQVATGYKAGGVNPRPTSDATITTFHPEELTSYEIGAKTEWLEHRLRLNVAAFYSDYTDLQLESSSADSEGNLIVAFQNVSRATIYGAELEMVAQPSDALSFDLNAGWQHYRAYDLGGAAYDPVTNSGGVKPGSPPPMSPRWKGGAGAQYTQSLGGPAGSLTLRADGSYQSRMYFDNQGTLAASQAGFGLLNLSLSWQSADGNWRTTLRADNVLEKEYYASIRNNMNPLGIISGTPGEPRMIMLTLRRNFAPE